MATAATCSASVRVQQMAMEAAVHGDVTLLKQAMLHDPLVSAVCNPEEIWQMADEMLVAQAEWLPNYRPEDIAAAEKRLSEHVANGTRVKLSDTQGAARLHTRSVAELAKDKEARETAKTSDKGKFGSN
jgi:alpha-galactosidase